MWPPPARAGLLLHRIIPGKTRRTLARFVTRPFRSFAFSLDRIPGPAQGFDGKEGAGGWGVRGGGVGAGAPRLGAMPHGSAWACLRSAILERHHGVGWDDFSAMRRITSAWPVRSVKQAAARLVQFRRRFRSHHVPTPASAACRADFRRQLPRPICLSDSTRNPSASTSASSVVGSKCVRCRGNANSNQCC